MADSVETAIYRLRFEGEEQIKRATRELEGLAEAEEDATDSNRRLTQQIQRGLAAYDPIIKAQQQYNKQLELNKRAREAGAASLVELDAHQDLITQNYQRQVGAIQAAEKATLGHANATKLSRYEMINMSRQLQDVGVSLAGGQSPLMVGIQQIPQMMDVLATSGVSVKAAFSQVGSAILGWINPLTATLAITTALGVATLALANAWDKVMVSSQRAISGAGTRTGTSIDDLNKFAGQTGRVSTTGLSEVEARKLAEGLTATGDIVISKLGGMSDAVVGFANQSGKSIDEAIKDFVRFGTDPVKAMDELGKVFGPVDQHTRELVEGFQVAGDKTAALAALIRGLADESRKAAETMTLVEKAWRGIVTLAGKGATGPTGLGDQLKAAQDRLAALQAAPQFGGSGQAGMTAMRASDIKAAADEVDRLNEKMRSDAAATYAAQLKHVADEARGVTEAAIPQIEQLRKLEEQLNKLKAAQAQGGGDYTVAIQALEVMVQKTNELKDATARANEYTLAIAGSWGNVSQSVAMALNELQLQLPLAQAVTGQQQMAAQYAIDFANALREGKTELEASALAAAKLGSAQAAANAAVEKQTQSLKDQTEMIKARQNGTEATTAAAQAYRNAIASGADATAAAALSAATLKNNMAQAAGSASSFYNAMQSAGSNMNAGMSNLLPTGTGDGTGWVADNAGEQGSFKPTTMTGGVFSTDPRVNVSYKSGGRGKTLDVGAYTTFVQKILENESALPEVLVNMLKDSELTKSTELTKSIDDLKESTDSLNSTNQELLSPYYTIDPRTSHIGFRSQGMARGGYVDVPGGISSNDNMLATVPVASGERIYVDPMTNRRGTSGGGGMVINISSPITINGNANADQFGRTLFQSNQSLAKQVRAAAQ